MTVFSWFNLSTCVELVHVWHFQARSFVSLKIMWVSSWNPYIVREFTLQPEILFFSLIAIAMALRVKNPNSFSLILLLSIFAVASAKVYFEERFVGICTDPFICLSWFSYVYIVAFGFVALAMLARVLAGLLHLAVWNYFILSVTWLVKDRWIVCPCILICGF